MNDLKNNGPSAVTLSPSPNAVSTLECYDHFSHRVPRKKPLNELEGYAAKLLLEGKSWEEISKTMQMQIKFAVMMLRRVFFSKRGVIKEAYLEHSGRLFEMFPSQRIAAEGPGELAEQVARLRYDERRTGPEIANELGITPGRVGRLLSIYHKRKQREAVTA